MNIPKIGSYTLALGIGIFVMTACRKEENKEVDPLPVAQTYDNRSFTIATEPITPLIQQLEGLTAEAARGRVPKIKVSATSLNTWFEGGSLSLKTATTPYFTSRLQAVNGFFVELDKASGGTFNPFDRRGQGGVFGGYLFDENGLEYEQLIQKGLYGAALYNYAVSLTEGSQVSPLTADQLLFLYGATPLFIGSDNASVHSYADRFLAGYAAQRDKLDGNGLYTRMKDAFTKYQSALKQGDRYLEERDEALAEIKLNWEKIMAATVIHNLHGVDEQLRSTRITDTMQAEALHRLSEAVGFLHGWRTIGQRHKKITDAELDGLLVKLNAPYDQAATIYRFVTNTPTLAQLDQVIAELKRIYGFSEREVEDFKTNWVSAQQR